MGRYYTHITLEDRCEMARLHTTGHSIRQIAATLDRAPSTVARELNRNGSTTQGYRPAMPTNKPGRAAGRAPSSTATARSAPRSWRSSNTAGPPNRWPAASPGARPTGSHETIYRFIYAQMARKTEYAWDYPQAFGRRCYKGRSPASFIALLAERPAAAADRTPGHWEADLMLFRIYGQAILTLHERHSRLLIAARPPGKAGPHRQGHRHPPRALAPHVAPNDHLR